MTDSSTARRFPRWLTVAVGVLGFSVVVAGLMLWLVGAFKPKVANQQGGPSESRPIGAGRVVELASRLIARVTEVNAIAGQKVAQGDVLVRLDDTDLKARLAQDGGA